MVSEYWKAVEAVWTSISIYDGPAVFLQQYRRVKPEVGLLFAAHWLYSEVCNGGFHQFFSNSTGVLAPEAARGFRAIGLQDSADLIEKAMQWFGEPYPRERVERIDRLGSLTGENREEWDPFLKLDEEFYDQLEAGLFDRAADEYARVNAVRQTVRPEPRNQIS